MRRTPDGTLCGRAELDSSLPGPPRLPCVVIWTREGVPRVHRDPPRSPTARAVPRPAQHRRSAHLLKPTDGRPRFDSPSLTPCCLGAARLRRPVPRQRSRSLRPSLAGAPIYGARISGLRPGRGAHPCLCELRAPGSSPYTESNFYWLRLGERTAKSRSLRGVLCEPSARSRARGWRFPSASRGHDLAVSAPSPPVSL